MGGRKRRFRWVVADLLWALLAPMNWVIERLERGRHGDIDAALRDLYRKCPHWQRCSRCDDWGCTAPVMGNRDRYGRPLCEKCARALWRARGLAV